MPGAPPRRSRASRAERRACSSRRSAPPRWPRSRGSSGRSISRSSARSASCCSRVRAAASSSTAAGRSGSAIRRREVVVPVGFTILEASRLGQIPHASVCGGRGRCSTCRVPCRRAGSKAIPAPSADERRVLERVAAPPGVRPACQSRPGEATWAVRPLSATATAPARTARRAAVARRERAGGHGALRGSPQVHRAGRAAAAVRRRLLPQPLLRGRGARHRQTGGVTNQFTGDGVMALFGVDTPSARGCRQALPAPRPWRGASPR